MSLQKLMGMFSISRTLSPFLIPPLSAGLKSKTLPTDGSKGGKTPIE